MLKPSRIARIRASDPSQDAIKRERDAGARTDDEAREVVWTKRIAWAEAQQTRTTWNGTTPRRGRKGIVPFAECLTPDQARLAGAGIAPLDHRPQDQADCLAWADFFSSAAPSGEASVNPSPAGASFPSKRKAA